MAARVDLGAAAFLAMNQFIISSASDHSRVSASYDGPCAAVSLSSCDTRTASARSSGEPWCSMHANARHASPKPFLFFFFCSLRMRAGPTCAAYSRDASFSPAPDRDASSVSSSFTPASSAMAVPSGKVSAMSNPSSDAASTHSGGTASPLSADSAPRSMPPDSSDEWRKRLNLSSSLDTGSPWTRHDAALPTTNPAVRCMSMSHGMDTNGAPTSSTTTTR